MTANVRSGSGAGTASRRPYRFVRLLLCAAPLALALPLPTAAAPPSSVTLLHLSATGEVKPVPDLLVAQLTGEASAPGPAEAQQRLDRLMASAKRLATENKTVSWRLEGYAVDHGITDAAHGGGQVWTVRQTLQLELEAPNGGALLDLAGRLQAAGLTMGNLGWTLSGDRFKEAQAACIYVAMHSLRHQAEAVATSLGLTLGSFRDVTLEATGSKSPRPLLQAMAARTALDANEGAQTMDQTVDADIELHP